MNRPYSVPFVLVLALLLSCKPGTNRNSDPKISSVVTDKTFDPDRVSWKGPGVLLSPRYIEWQLSVPPVHLGTTDLFTHRPDDAGVFLQYGFTELVLAEYQHPAVPGVTVITEIYDMKTPLGSFGRLSLYLEQMSDPADAGMGLPEPLKHRGILRDDHLFFWTDRYFVHLSVVTDSRDTTFEGLVRIATEILPEIARQICRKQPNPSPDPSETNHFDRTDRMHRSITRHAHQTAGYDMLPGGFSARYRNTDRHQWRLFFTDPFPSAEAVRDAEDSLHISYPGQTKTRIIQNRMIGITIKDPNHAPTEALRNMALNTLGHSLEAVP